MKHPTEDHSLFGIDLIDELVRECLLRDNNGEGISDFVGDIEAFDCLRSIIDEADCDNSWEVHDLSDSEDDNIDLVDLSRDHVGTLGAESNQVSQLDPKAIIDNSSSPPPPIELKPLSSHLKYAYLDTEQQFLEDKLLHVLRRHKKAIEWKLSDLPGINPSICMHRILMEEEARLIRLNLTILDVAKKEVTKLLVAKIIYPISDNQWVSSMQVVPKKSRMTVMKNQYNELASHKDHFPFPFIDQVLEKLIHIAPEDQHKTTFTCQFGTFAYTRMPFGLCNVPITFQRYMTSIFSDLLQDCMEVFMDDFRVYADSFDACLENLSKMLTRCIDTNLVLNFEKCHFMVIEGIVLGHLVSNKGIEVDKLKIDIIISLPNPASVLEFHSFLGHEGFYRRFIKNFNKIALPLSKLLQKYVEFNFDHPYIEAFLELKN
ncbi:Retrovirus-related Pol polyprotein from transposon 17.6, partial [Mucuna pruriens]